MILSIILATIIGTPDTPWVRFYATQVPQMLANFEQYPESSRDFRLNVIMASPHIEAPKLRAITERAKALGIEVAPGARCFEIADPLGYMSEALWRRCAEFVDTIAASTDSRFLALDIEDYIYQPRAPSLEEQRRVAAPLIGALKRHGFRVAIYPAMVGDLATQAIADGMGGDLELWTEDVFGLSERVRTDPTNGAAMIAHRAKIQTHLEARWPRVVVRHGEFDHVLRAWGAPQRARSLELYGSRAPWIFDMIRADNAAWGSPAWYSGASLSTTNNSIAEWRMPPHAAWPVLARGTVPLSSFPLTKPGESRTDLRSSLGWLASSPAGTALRAATWIKGSASFSVSAEAMLPGTVGGVVVGSNQANHESWQVAIDAATQAPVLELRHAGGVERVPMGAALPRRVPVRVAVSSEGGAVWRWAVQGAGAITTGEHRPRLAVSAGAGALWFGVGTYPPTYRAQWLDGLVVRRGELWSRALSASEIGPALAPFPRVQ